MNPATDTTRRADLAKIHLAKKELCMSDEDYAAVISRVSKGRTQSAGELDMFERGKVLAHFKRCGWQPKVARKPNQPYSRPVTADSPEARKARALWLFLHELGEVRDPSERALGHYAKRVLKVDALQWTRKLWKLIESLKDWGMRVLPARCEAMREQLAPHHADLPQAIAEQMQAAWNYLQQRKHNKRLFDEYEALYQALNVGLQHVAKAADLPESQKTPHNAKTTPAAPDVAPQQIGTICAAFSRGFDASEKPKEE